MSSDMWHGEREQNALMFEGLPSDMLRGSTVVRLCDHTLFGFDYPASTPSNGGILEALWKQEGRKWRETARGGGEVYHADIGAKLRILRGISKNRESKRSPLHLTHNLKVAGSNPAPATKFALLSQ
jgi:hypothetical protein